MCTACLRDALLCGTEGKKIPIEGKRPDPVMDDEDIFRERYHPSPFLGYEVATAMEGRPR